MSAGVSLLRLVGIRLMSVPNGKIKVGQRRKNSALCSFFLPVFFGMKLAGFENLCLPQTDTGLPSQLFLRKNASVSGKISNFVFL